MQLTWKKIDAYAIQSSDSNWRITRANLSENVRYVLWQYGDGKWAYQKVSGLVSANDMAARSKAVAEFQDEAEAQCS